MEGAIPCKYLARLLRTEPIVLALDRARRCDLLAHLGPPLVRLVPDSLLVRAMVCVKMRPYMRDLGPVFETGRDRVRRNCDVRAVRHGREGRE